MAESFFGLYTGFEDEAAISVFQRAFAERGIDVLALEYSTDAAAIATFAEAAQSAGFSASVSADMALAELPDPLGDLVIDPDLTLTGTSASDELFGMSGNDTLMGRGDADVLVGAGGDDSLRGGRGGDELYGEDGDDVLRGSAGQDYLDGGAGAPIPFSEDASRTTSRAAPERICCRAVLGMTSCSGMQATTV